MKKASPDQPGRKAEIIRRREAGELMRVIAGHVGVTTQYVSHVLKQVEREGVERTLAPATRGRPKEQLITETEAEGLGEFIRSGLTGPDASVARWTHREVQAWFQQHHGRRISLYQLRRFCHDRGLKLTLTADPYVLAGEEGPRPPDGPTTAAGDIDDPGAPELGRSPQGAPGSVRMTATDLEAMRRSNAEVAQRIQQSQMVADATTRALATAAPSGPRLGRNDPCPLDPKKKFKRCCGATGAKHCFRVAG